MDKQTKEREELYAKVPPPGDLIPINVKPFDINDDTLGDVEIREVVGGMRNGKVGRASKIRAKDMKDWLLGAIEEEEKGTEGAGDKWRVFVSADTNHLGARMHPASDALGYSRSPAEGRRRLLWYWSVGTVLEGRRNTDRQMPASGRIP